SRTPGRSQVPCRWKVTGKGDPPGCGDRTIRPTGSIEPMSLTYPPIGSGDFFRGAPADLLSLYPCAARTKHAPVTRALAQPRNASRSESKKPFLTSAGLPSL